VGIDVADGDYGRAEQVGWRGLARNLEREAPQWASLLPQLPRLAHRLLATDPTAGIEAKLDAILAAERRRNRLLAALTVVGAGMLATLLYVLIAS
jgi:ubiquinone biosynthesis protein